MFKFVDSMFCYTKQLQKAIATLMAFLLIVIMINVGYSHHAAANTDTQEDKQHRIYFSLADEHGFPSKIAKTKFDCSDKIYTVIELKNYLQSKDKHTLSIRWTDPSGTTREHTQYQFHTQQQSTRVWGWLSLSRGRGAGMLQWINPAAGLEDFIGPWTIKVRIDDKPISSSQFEVYC